MKPADPIRSANSSSRAGRKAAPSVFASLMSFTRWSPRTTTMVSPRSSTITGYAFSSVPGSTCWCCATSATVVRPGVSIRSGASLPSGSATGRACALATSTLAA